MTPPNPAASTEAQARRRPAGGAWSRLWIKLLLAYLLPTGAIVAGIGLLAYQAARNAMEDQLGQALQASARTAAQQVGRRRTVELRPGDEQSRTYRTLVEKLAALRSAAKLRRAFLFDRQERCLGDSQAAYAIGERIPELAANRAELKDVFAGHARASVLFTGRDGTLYKSGFAPVSLDDRIVAAVGVDGSATFFGPLSQLGQTLALVGLLALALVLLATLLASRRITRPLDRLAQAARAIGQGELEGEIRVETGDEIGTLAATLNDMRKAILSRDRRMQMMLSGIAHEVRNPLGGMTLFVGLLREEVEDEATRSHVTRIEKELDYLARVVNDFLDFARKKPPEVSKVDPRAELEQVRSLCQAAADHREVSLSVEVAPEVTEVAWDQERMRRAVLNLVHNAIQASDAGGRVALDLVPGSANELVLIVTDQGCGIPEDKREQVFEPFFTTRQKGTGLGLALVRKTVEDHGGTISIEDAQSAGTRFVVRLPRIPVTP